MKCNFSQKFIALKNHWFEFLWISSQILIKKIKTISFYIHSNLGIQSLYVILSEIAILDFIIFKYFTLKRKDTSLT